MTPLAKFVRNVVQRAAGVFHEGPNAPERLGEQVLDFANENPKATRKQWADFARAMASQAWREGFVRGWEHGERDPDPPWKNLPPELVADAHDPDWRWSPALGPDLALPEEVPEELEQAPELDLRRHVHNEQRDNPAAKPRR